ncbi:hypothetical protein A4H97_06810 [Niastella yeongjuensis]|uniref:DUF5723 domain-containing protein n=1 Tax=Niastella yeongjuensis TaxID=354355 RepID=A0A1V9EM38_9BACT|nr:hypothetical protein [Niastella yeongjuensis]OQP47210.1 hypothetical protein A4H97_06810 [Niastella yeongjuensis]SEN74262.1 hypothetical protein SAMN05660816_01388 [Niastella yeongjuensis]
MVNHFNKKWLLHALWLLLVHTNGYAQNYYALQGSNYAGSLGIGNNPASIVNTPYKWDVTIFGVQKKNATNSVVIHNWSLFSNPAKSEYSIREGDFKRFVYDDLNVNLLNTRIALNRKQAIGFGLNLRSYTQASTGPVNFVDTLTSTRDFFDLGNYDRKLSADAIHSAWVEFFVTWAQTIWDRTDSRLNAGVTAKLTRGVSGAYVNILNGSATSTVHNNINDYTLQDVYAEYEYSSNYDGWQKEKGTRQNLRDFLSHSQTGVSFDFGLEYLIKPQQILTVFDDDTYYDYNWKIGLSLLDVGFNPYKYGVNSRRVSGFHDNITDTVLDIRFDDIDKLQDFNERLNGIAKNIKQPGGTFHVVNPMRLVLNVDHFITGAWYVNGNASLNLSSLSGKERRLTELNMLTVTPRWETRRLGFFLPIQFNTKEKLWVGGAVKFGPLLLGIHNWANVFSKNKMQNGGAYLALVLRPGKNTATRLDKRLDCPPN